MQEILLVLGFVAGGFGAPWPGPALGAVAVQLSPVPAAGPPKPHVVKPVIATLSHLPACDEVACLIDPDSCGRHCVPPPHHHEQILPEPDRLEREDVLNGINPIKAKVEGCGGRFAFKGTVRVKMTIQPSGTLSSVTPMADNLPPELATCVTKAVQTARFRHSGVPLSVIFPFVLR